jgi:integrase
VIHLREEELFSDTDPLFPKANIEVRGGRFAKTGFAREGYSGVGKFNAIIRQAFAHAHLPEFTPHAFRKTLARHCDQISRTREEFKALSMNLGHEHVSTTVDSYIPMSSERQGEIVRGLNTRH